jgi:hypothetical protein
MRRVIESYARRIIKRYAYWNLTPRGKFIRTLWFGPLALLVLGGCIFLGAIPEMLRLFQLPEVEKISWGYFLFSLLVFIVQLAHTWHRYQQDRKDNAL